MTDREAFEAWWAENHPWDWWASERNNIPLPSNDRLRVWDIANKAWQAALASERAKQVEPDDLDRYCHIELPGVRAALSKQAEPYCYVYEFDTYGGAVRRSLSPAPYNGNSPDRTVTCYAAPPAVQAQQAEMPPSAGLVEPKIIVAGPTGCGKSAVMELVYKALRDAGLHPYSDDLAHERRMVNDQPLPSSKVWKLVESNTAPPADDSFRDNAVAEIASLIRQRDEAVRLLREAREELDTVEYPNDPPKRVMTMLAAIDAYLARVAK